MAGYDVIIIGGGSAGLTAGLYALRAGLKAVLLERAVCGGQLLLTERIENFPGFPDGIIGRNLAERFKDQAIRSGLKIIIAEVKEIVSAQAAQAVSRYTIKTQEGDFSTHAVILACGAEPKRLGVPGEEMLIGRGVSYCATCDGPLFRGRDIVVVGGGNTACEEAIYLSRFARRIRLLHRRDRLRADQVLQDRLKGNPKISLIWNSILLQILGQERVRGVTIGDVRTCDKRELACEGVFIFVGRRPNTDFVRGLVDMDNKGFIVAGADLQSSLRGIFTCGDCRAKAVPQVVVAASEGARAALACRDYIRRLKGSAYV